MTNNTTEQPTQEIPYGYCQCGCGQRTNTIPETNRPRGRIKGQHFRYIRGHNARQSLIERFWRYVRADGPEGCWLWTGATASCGYGKLNINRRSVRAHRIAYELLVGPIPEGHLVLHKCNNPACCNPAHLTTGSHKDNTAYMMQCGRQRNRVFRGMDHARAKLTDDQVRAIRIDYDAGTTSIAQLAVQYHISESQCGRIVHRESWKHLP